MERGNHLFYLNYAITLYNNDEVERARAQFDEFETLFEQLDEEAKAANTDVTQQRVALGLALKAM